MKLIKNVLYFSMLGGLLLLSSCEDDEVCDGKTCAAGEILDATTCDCITVMIDEDQVIVNGNISSDTEWTNDKTYILASRIAVESGSTLTIQAGTVVKGQAGAGTNATALIIARGAKIIAEGTATSPIVFTSIADNIVSGGSFVGNLPDSQVGLWGGLIILGNAPISADADATQIEGIPPSDQNGLYGGTVGNDDSGILRYVSIRHGGADLNDGDEINGLTLGGVGSQTVIDHVEIVSNFDDGIEFFGGTVNATNILVWNQGDDAFDCDQAWTGTLDNYIGIMGPNSDHALELDGPEGTMPGTYTLTNGTLKGYNVDGKDGGEYADLRADVRCVISNTYFLNFSEDSDVELDNDGVSTNYTQGLISLSNLQFDVSHLTAGNLTIEEIFVDNGSTNAFDAMPADASIVTAKSTGADASKFAGWTMAAARGQLVGL